MKDYLKENEPQLFLNIISIEFSNNKALMHEVLLLPEMKSRDTNIPNSINAIIEQDTETYIKSFYSIFLYVYKLFGYKGCENTQAFYNVF